MSLTRPLIVIDLRKRKLPPALPIESFEDISQSPLEVQEDVISSPYTPLARASENSSKDTELLSSEPLPSSSGIISTDSAGDDLPVLTCGTNADLNIPRHPHRPDLMIDSAVGTATEDRETPRLDMPSGLSGLVVDEQESFHISVRDFTQSKPDFLIGYNTTAPVNEAKQPLNASTLAIKDNEPSKIKISSLDRPPSYSKLPILHTGTSEHKAARIENRHIHQISHDSESSAPIVTAPEMPLFGRLSDHSNFSYDGVSASAKDRDPTAYPADANTFDNDQVSPTSNISSGTHSDYPVEDRRSSVDTLDCQASVPSTSDIATIDALPPPGRVDDPRALIAAPDATITGDTTNTRGILDNNDVDNSEPRIEMVRDQTSYEVNSIEDNLMGTVLPSHATVLGVPRDITGELPPPGLQTPVQSAARLGKRRRILESGQKFYRRLRTMVLGRRVLSLIIGRQLAKPTRHYLLAISKGLPVNIVDLTATKPDDPLPILA
jgi:hypothetical protein